MTFLLSCALQVSAILLVSFAVLRLLRSQPAALRHYVLSVAIFCSLLMPALRLVVPQWNVSLPVESSGLTVVPEPALNTALPSVAPYELQSTQEADAKESFDIVQTPDLPPAVSEVPLSTNPIKPILSISRIIEGLWLVGAGLGLFVLIAGIVQLKWIEYHSEPMLDAKWLGVAEEISRDYGLRPPLRLLQSRYPSMLATWGVMRPAILLPKGAGEWSGERIHAVLSHEIAHVRRRDWLMQSISEVFRTIYWFNPLAWIVCTRLCQESEQSCDDLVLHRGISGPDYADHLLALARNLNAGGPLWNHAVLMARQSTLKRRFKAILSPNTNRRAVPRAAVMVSVITALAIALPIAGLRASAVTSAPALSGISPSAATVSLPSMIGSKVMPVPVVTMPAFPSKAAPIARIGGTLRPALESASGVLLSGIASLQATGKPIAFDGADVHPSADSIRSRLTGPFGIGGLYRVQNASLLDLIAMAYGVDAAKVVGGPAWLAVDHFDVAAKVPSGTTAATLKIMLQTLLAERFKLTIHSDSQPVPAYALSVGPNPLLKQADGTGDAGCKAQPQSSPAQGGNGIGSFSCRNMSIDAFVQRIPSMAGPDYLNGYKIIDLTELKGAWNFDFAVTRFGTSVPAGADRITLFDAVRKLGLELNLSHVPSPVIVVDSANRKPAENPTGLVRRLLALPAAFEVAEIKPTSPDFKTSPTLRSQPGVRVNVQGYTLQMLIETAWDIGDETFGHNWLAGPEFLDKERFDIVAQAPALAPPEPSGAYSTAQDLDLISTMLRTLLIERFKMVFHYEDRPVPAFVLTAVKPKLQKADPSNRTGCHDGPGPDGKYPRIANPVNALLETCQNMTMAQLAKHLQGIAGYTGRAAVLDSTGLDGAWDFTLNYSRYGTANRGGGAAGTPGASDPNGALTLFEALEKQLGLKLEMTKRPGSVLVIDHMEQMPTPN